MGLSNHNAYGAKEEGLKIVLLPRQALIRGWSYMLKCETYHSHVYCVTEMVAGGGWKLDINIGTSDREDHKLRATGELNTNADRKTSGIYRRIGKMIFKTIAYTLLGDLTSNVFEDLFDNILGS